MPGQKTSHGKLIFVYVIKPTVTDEMAVSSTGLGQVTREKGPLGHGPCQKTRAERSLRRAPCSWTLLWYLTSIATGGQAPV